MRVAYKFYPRKVDSTASKPFVRASDMEVAVIRTAARGFIAVKYRIMPHSRGVNIGAVSYQAGYSKGRSAEDKKLFQKMQKEAPVFKRPSITFPYVKRSGVCVPVQRKRNKDYIDPNKRVIDQREEHVSHRYFNSELLAEFEAEFEDNLEAEKHPDYSYYEWMKSVKTHPCVIDEAYETGKEFIDTVKNTFFSSKQVSDRLLIPQIYFATREPIEWNIEALDRMILEKLNQPEELSVLEHELAPYTGIVLENEEITEDGEPTGWSRIRFHRVKMVSNQDGEIQYRVLDDMRYIEFPDKADPSDFNSGAVFLCNAYDYKPGDIVSEDCVAHRFSRLFRLIPRPDLYKGERYDSVEEIKKHIGEDGVAWLRELAKKHSRIEIDGVSAYDVRLISKFPRIVTPDDFYMHKRVSSGLISVATEDEMVDALVFSEDNLRVNMYHHPWYQPAKRPPVKNSIGSIIIEHNSKQETRS